MTSDYGSVYPTFITFAYMHVIKRRNQIRFYIIHGKEEPNDFHLMVSYASFCGVAKNDSQVLQKLSTLDFI